MSARSEAPSAGELFDSALESYGEGDIGRAVTCLRAAFFENLYLAPALIGEEFHPQSIWHPGRQAEPASAMEYVARRGHLWREREGALLFLAEVWRDPLVRRELESYIRLSKAILNAPGPSARAEYLRERQWFVDQRRIRGTQSEILGRLERTRFLKPVERPRVAAIQLAALDPARTVDFFRDLFLLDPVRTSRRARGYAEFELPGVRLIIHGHDRPAAGDPYGLGPRPSSLGWGAVFLIRVREFDRYHEHAEQARIPIVDRDLETPGERFFVVKDPSGYLFEISE